MSQNESAISAQGLKKSYKNVPVLTGVDFEVRTGSIFALLGSNGAGKTTIVKILTTYAFHTSLDLDCSLGFSVA